MARPKPPRAHLIDSGMAYQVLVSHTTSPLVATVVAAPEYADATGMDLAAMDVPEAADLLAGLHVIRVGLFRKNPCHPSSCWEGGGHGWHLGYAKRPGPGVFPGVLVGTLP